MKKLTSLLVLSISTSFLTACGYAYKDAYKGEAYTSTNYLENYYDIWDYRIDEQNENNKINNKTSREVKESDNLFLSYNSDNFLNVESQRDSLKFDASASEEENYGMQRKLSNRDSSFKYGIMSKLFDGHCFCEHRFERARVQVKASNQDIPGYNYRSGFGFMFPKECVSASYVAMSFRCATDPQHPNTSNVTNSQSDISITLSFYIDNGDGFDKNSYIINLADATTNNGGTYNNNGYSFVGFELGKDIQIENCAGFSFEYSLNGVYKNGAQVDQDRAHSLMLYEFVLADSIWH